MSEKTSEKELRKAVMAVFFKKEDSSKQGKVLIGSSPRDGGFKFPQGGLEPGESPLEGIKREVFEELGVQIKENDIITAFDQPVRYFYPENFRPEKHGLSSRYYGQEQYVFLIRFRSDMNLIPQDDEFEKMIWIEPSELENYDTQHRCDAYRKALDMCFSVISVTD